MQDAADWPENLPRRTIVVNGCHTMLRMLHRTPGYMIGNIWQAQELACSGIVSIPLRDAPVQQNLVLVRRQRQLLSPYAHLFLTDFLKDQELPTIQQQCYIFPWQNWYLLDTAVCGMIAPGQKRTVAHIFVMCDDFPE